MISDKKYQLPQLLTAVLALAGLTFGIYLSHHLIFPYVLALNDTTKTWTFDTAHSSDYTYDAALMAVDNSGAHPISGVNKITNPAYGSDNSGWTAAAAPPSGWAEVPGNNDLYGTSNFLVMQYEAKAWDTQTNSVVADGGFAGPAGWAGNNTQTRYQARSISEGRPWVYIAQSQASEYDAFEACSALGSAYHLITNNEWMTIARNAEQVPTNWTNGSVGNGALFRGNSNTSASLDGSSALTGINTRTHRLSNGSIVWDLAGNVYDWTSDTILRNQQPLAWNGSVDDATGFNWSDYSSGSLARYIKEFKAGSPLQQVNAGPSNLAWNANQGVGRIYHYSDPADVNTTIYGFLRGGYWSESAYAGVFSLNLISGPGNRNTIIGFRCASDPVAISQSYNSSSGRSGGGNTLEVGSITNAKIFQSINVGSADIFDFSVYVYDETSGNQGGEVSSAVAQLYYHGSAVSTTYTNVGSGWWKLSGTLTGANEQREYGLLVKTGKTVKVDDWTLAKEGEYSVYTTTAYTNGQVSTWDSLSPSVSVAGNASVRYQLCDDDGSVCQAGNAWQYWDGDSWETAANTTTHTNSAAELTQEAMQAFAVGSQKISVKIVMGFGGADLPALTSLTLGLTTDITTPPTNASDITMKRSVSGTSMSSNDWTNNSSPYFSWSPGSDNDGGAGIRGYCLYLGTDPDGDPATSKGLLGTSPGSTAGSDCQFVVTSTSVDFSTLSYRGSPWLTSDTEPYYLNVKAIDNGGNVFSGSAESFQFRFDNTPPANVAYISPASGNFSNVVDMNFGWPTVGGSASSDNHAQVLGWQYQINSTSGTWLGTTSDEALGVNYIPTSQSSYNLTQDQDGNSIVSGNNVVYFRTVDAAGNVSSEATIRTGNLSYGGAAPNWEGAQAVAVTPNVSSDNSFALSWPEAEASIGQSVAGYYYMVNTTPPSTYGTLVGNAATYIAAGTSTSIAAQSLPNVNKGTNTVYVIAVDDAATPNYSPSNYISGTFTLNSTDPDNVGNLVASDSSIKSQQQWNVTLTWTAPVYQGAGNLNYLVQRSADGVNFTQVGTTSGLSYVDTTPSSAKYYYKIITQDGANSVSSGSNSVTLTPTGKWTSPPSLESGPTVSGITTKKAQITWTTNRSSDSKVAFGTKSGEYNKEEPSNSDQVSNHTINLTNLNPGTKYFYRAKWTDEDGNTAESDEKTFETQPAPTVKDVVARNVGLTSAIIEFTSNGASKVKIYYGTSTDFGGVKEVLTSTGETTYTVELIGLNDGTKYYYKINAFDTESGEYEGTILDFETLPRPLITNVRLEQVANTAESTVRVTWNTNTEVSSIVTYYPENNPQAARDEVKVALERGAHTLMVRGLLPETSYLLVVKGRDRLGNEAVSDIQRFTTATDTRPPQILGLKVIGGTVPPVGFAAGDIRAQLIISWNTDEPATSQVEFGEGTGTTYAQKSQEDGNLTNNHTVILSNLTPSQVYHLRAISKDAAGNEAKSVDTVTIAPKATRSALDLVIKNLSEAFGFVGSLRLP